MNGNPRALAGLDDEANSRQAQTRGFSRATDTAGFKPVLLCSPYGARERVEVIEDNGDHFVTALVPWAPKPLAGSVKRVPRDRAEMLPAPLAERSRVLNRWDLWRARPPGRANQRHRPEAKGWNHEQGAPGDLTGGWFLRRGRWR
jgi:hypothetical protein